MGRFSPPGADERARRARFLTATIVTCVALLVIGGSLHVVLLGSVRMDEMRDKATYNLREEPSRIRAAGEDLVLHAQHEKLERAAAEGGAAVSGYTVEQAESLLTPAQWEDLGSMVTVPGGPFKMGTNLERADAQDRPEHRVDVAPFRIDKYL
ncbi:MAG TPA: SUMF1/EgtB/PvdO family nonheme iron enzyme, partial [Burkholderiaceae bacterium]